MHLADFVYVVVQRCYARLLFAEHGASFSERPGEIVAIVVHGNVGVLRGVEAGAFAVAEPFIHPANDVAGDSGEEFQAGCLVGMHIIFQQLGVVVAHLFEVRHYPAFIHRVAMKTSGQLVVDTAVGHVLKRGDDDVSQVVMIRPLVFGSLVPGPGVLLNQ